MNRYRKNGRPKGVTNEDYQRLDTRANDLVGRCPKCHLLYPADCVPGQCMARVAPWDQLDAIRRLFVAMNMNQGREAYEYKRRDADNEARRLRRLAA